MAHRLLLHDRDSAIEHRAAAAAAQHQVCDLVSDDGRLNNRSRAQSTCEGLTADVYT